MTKLNVVKCNGQTQISTINYQWPNKDTIMLPF